jgi:hypothetical protein
LRAVAAGGGRKEEPDVRTVARARALNRHRQSQSAAGLHERTYVVHPRALVEINGQKPARLVVLHRIDAHHMLALQVGEHGGVIDRLEHLPGTVTALHFREPADTGHELVGAGWGIPRLARLRADELGGVDVRTTTEKLTKKTHLVCWRAGASPDSGEGVTREGGVLSLIAFANRREVLWQT